MLCFYQFCADTLNNQFVVVAISADFLCKICAKLIRKGAKSNACADALRQERPWAVPAVPPKCKIRNQCYETPL